jgi:signal transduction histidine kinase
MKDDDHGLLPATAPSLADRILRQLRERGGLTAVLRTTGPALARLYGSTDAFWAVRDVTGSRGFLWVCNQSIETSDGPRRYSEPPPSAMAGYFAGPPGDWMLTREGNGSKKRTWRLWVQGTGHIEPPPDLIQHAGALATSRDLTSMISVEIPPVGDWTGRFLLLNPSKDDRETMVSSVAGLARQIGPVMLAKHENRVLRMQVRAEERALLARELHDGVIQSLLGLEIRLHMLGRRAGVAGPAHDALAGIQKEIHDQVVSLRRLTEHLHPADLEPSRLSTYLANIVERFEREAGITATLDASLDAVAFTPSMCVELLRVIQEALANIRRHSCARSVHVCVKAHAGSCVMEIADDGRGFPFEGRLTLDELQRALQGPRVIMERVRALGGDLTVESRSSGARLEIRIPMATGYAVA